MVCYHKIVVYALATLCGMVFIAPTCHGIDSLLQWYNRPFTVLTIAPEEPANMLNLAAKFRSSVFVLLAPAPIVIKGLYDEKPENVIALDQQASLWALHRLGECEHFDVTFAPRLFEIFGENWRCALHTMLSLTDYTLFYVPKNYLHSETAVYLKSLGAILVEGNKRLYMVYRPKTALIRKTWFNPRRSEFTIVSTFSEKKLVKHDHRSQHDIVTPWIPGINLVTFKVCSGVYPSTETIKNSVKELAYEDHTDWGAYNMIVQGTRVMLIDIHGSMDEHYPKRERPERLNSIVAWLDINDIRKMESYYWKHITAKYCSMDR